jgi:hypothetical protein
MFSGRGVNPTNDERWCLFVGVTTLGVTGRA